VGVNKDLHAIQPPSGWFGFKFAMYSLVAVAALLLLFTGRIWWAESECRSMQYKACTAWTAFSDHTRGHPEVLSAMLTQGQVEQIANEVCAGHLYMHKLDFEMRTPEAQKLVSNARTQQERALAQCKHLDEE